MRKRSRYRPGPVNPQAHLMAMQGTCRFDRTDALLRAERLHLAVEDVAKAQADQAQWRVIFDAVNMTEQWVRHGVVDRAAAPHIEALQTTIEAVMDRTRATGRRALRYDELAALRDFAACYVDILCGVTMSDYFKAQEAVERRIRRVLAGERMGAGHEPGVRVVEAV